MKPYKDQGDVHITVVSFQELSLTFFCNSPVSVPEFRMDVLPSFHRNSGILQDIQYFIQSFKIEL
jgi:ABC-type uncharacterized transport system YnjBCD ATPase subunit